MDSIAWLPNGTNDVIRAAVEAISKALGERLESAMLVGNAMNPSRADRGRAPEIIVIVRGDSLDDVAAIGVALRAPMQRGARIRIVTLRELDRSRDVFALEIAAWRARHIVLAGRDLVEGIELADADLRRCIEAELRGLSRRVRNRVLAAVGTRGARDDAAHAVLGGFDSLLVASFHALALLGVEPPRDEPAILRAIGERAGADAAPLLPHLSVLRKGAGKLDAMAALSALLAFVDRVNELVDSLGEATDPPPPPLAWRRGGGLVNACIRLACAFLLGLAACIGWASPARAEHVSDYRIDVTPKARGWVHVRVVITYADAEDKTTGFKYVGTAEVVHERVTDGAGEVNGRDGRDRSGETRFEFHFPAGPKTKTAILEFDQHAETDYGLLRASIVLPWAHEFSIPVLKMTVTSHGPLVLDGDGFRCTGSGDARACTATEDGLFRVAIPLQHDPVLPLVVLGLALIGFGFAARWVVRGRHRELVDLEGIVLPVEEEVAYPQGNYRVAPLVPKGGTAEPVLPEPFRSAFSTRVTVAIVSMCIPLAIGAFTSAPVPVPFLLAGSLLVWLAFFAAFVRAENGSVLLAIAPTVITALVVGRDAIAMAVHDLWSPGAGIVLLVVGPHFVIWPIVLYRASRGGGGGGGGVLELEQRLLRRFELRRRGWRRRRWFELRRRGWRRRRRLRWLTRVRVVPVASRLVRAVVVATSAQLWPARERGDVP